VTAADAPVVVLLHGYGMRPTDLSPFAASIGLRARFLFPEGPLATANGGRAWWSLDEERRAAEIAHGPRDLSGERPPGLPAARERLAALLAEVSGTDLVLGGFSQGAMLCCDFVLRAAATLPAALVLLSPAPIGFAEWEPLLPRVRGLPVFVSHGRSDPDLDFAAAERLQAALAGAGARVTWVPFDGGHEIPFPVWRALKIFLLEHVPTMQRSRLG
jgi:phospholipase/carboxylesterase